MFPLRVLKRDIMPLGSRVLRAGSCGRDVRALQQSLKELGYLAEIDGRYGLVTEEAVRRLQARHRLRRDGLAGPATLLALRDAERGAGLACHRLRGGETVDDAAAALGVTAEVVRRENDLRRRDRPPAGTLLMVPQRLLVLQGGEAGRLEIPCSAVLEPSLSWDGSALVHEGAAGGSRTLPLLTMDADAWQRTLAQPGTWPILIRGIERHLGQAGPARWAIDLPARTWTRGRALGRFLSHLRTSAVPPIPYLRWPPAGGARPNLAAVARLAAPVLLDPGTLAFTQTGTALLIRNVARIIPPRCLVVFFKPGGLLRSGDESRFLSLSEARAAAISARARSGWDEVDRVYRAALRGDKSPQELYILEARALRSRARLIDRLGCCGMGCVDLAALAPRPVPPWPGEFAVLDSFLPPRHIDY